MKSLSRLTLVVGLSFVAASGKLGAQTVDPISEVLTTRQLNLATEGTVFLLDEASRASFLLIGGLHGDRETGALVQTLVSRAAPFGYRNVVMEMSPWATDRLESSLNVKASPSGPKLSGADIEEPRPDLLIRQFAQMNSQNREATTMADIVKDGYKRTSAAEMLQLARQMTAYTDSIVGGISLHNQVIKTLEVEAARIDRNARLNASLLRETYMKELFFRHYRAAAQTEGKPKFVVTFGQSHLGRGIDERGVSTLGNFIAELAVAEGTKSFHVLLFAAGGKVSYGGVVDIDQRKDDVGWAFLASISRYPAAVFDLRPIRQPLHNAAAPLSPRDAALLSWADSYDAIICYREVTPLGN